MQPCKSKGLNWPFRRFSGGLLWLQSGIPAMARSGGNTVIYTSQLFSVKGIRFQNLNFWRFTNSVQRLFKDFRRLPKISCEFRRLLKISWRLPKITWGVERFLTTSKQDSPTVLCGKKLNFYLIGFQAVTLAIVSWAWETGLNARDHNFRRSETHA